MRPYYEDGFVRLYHGDCRDVVPTLPRGLMVTDPPYNVGYHYDEHRDNLSDREYWAWLRSILRTPLVFLHYPEALFTLSRALRKPPTKVVAWVYHANTPKQWRSIGWFGVHPDFSRDGQAYKNPNDKRVRQLIADGKKSRLYDWWHIEQVKNVSAEKTAHPCQIPLELMMRVLRITPFTGPVIEPFAGSGTTLLAAQRLGREAIGVERSEAYCEIAAKRLAQGALDLFGEQSA